MRFIRCAPPPGNSPDRVVRAALARASILALLGSTLALASCSRDARAVRLPALDPSESIYRIECDKTIELCRDKAVEVCNGPYEVLESAGAPVQPKRVTSEPGPRSTGPRYQQVQWQGQLVVACGTAAGAHGVAGEAPPEEQRAPALPATPKLAPQQLCVPGATQFCLGPGACRGAQACLMDGRGYGACDCGNSAPPPRSGSDAGADGGAAHDVSAP